MCSNHMLFDALTLPVSNKDLGEFSDTCADNKGEKFCFKDVFLCQFPTFTTFCTILCIERFLSKKITIWPTVHCLQAWVL